jgi:N-acetyl-alpha-D-glucosaminyl L-malate synthase BshA
MKIGITCYPSFGGSGILASALGEALARRGYEVHFISYERPVRVPADTERIFFHPVVINDYGLFKYPDYTLPLSVKMAEVTRSFGLDVLHVHYAVPHATAAILARSMLENLGTKLPKIVTTLHGTDTTLLGRDPGYGPAIRHALMHSDTVTTVSDFLRGETQRLLNFNKPIEVIHNFFVPKQPRRTREEVRRDLGAAPDECVILHSSNLRPLKRIDLLLEAVTHLLGTRFKLVVLAGESFQKFNADVDRLGLTDHVVVRERVGEIEDYLQAADVGLISSEVESFCLSILEGMFFGFPSVAFAVGGIPEVVQSGKSGILVPWESGSAGLGQALLSLVQDPEKRRALGKVAKEIATTRFTADTVVPLYEAVYGGGRPPSALSPTAVASS